MTFSTLSSSYMMESGELRSAKISAKVASVPERFFQNPGVIDSLKNHGNPPRERHSSPAMKQKRTESYLRIR